EALGDGIDGQKKALESDGAQERGAAWRDEARVVTSPPSSTSLTSATGHDARWPPVMRAARVRRATNPSCVANAAGTTSSVAPVHAQLDVRAASSSPTPR